MVRIVFCASLAALLWMNSSMAAEHAVLQKNKLFSVAEITVKPGDTIVFKNDDDVAHNVFSSSAGFQFNLKMQPPGSSASFTFENEGKAEVRCVMHPTMKLMVDVKK
jgi:plastocyanin